MFGNDYVYYVNENGKKPSKKLDPRIKTLYVTRIKILFRLGLADVGLVSMSMVDYAELKLLDEITKKEIKRLKA